MKSFKDFGLKNQKERNEYPIKEYDANGKLIHYKNSNGFEKWNEYDANGNLIYHKDSYGYKEWNEYDANGKLIHYKNSNGYEEWKLIEGTLTLKNGVYRLNGEVVVKE